ncbi:hypothetical protein HAX54_045205, partial [Datura stramonium]|nr:hypothetical protein [Datura stramonium]
SPKCAWKLLNTGFLLGQSCSLEETWPTFFGACVRRCGLAVSRYVNRSMAAFFHFLLCGTCDLQIPACGTLVYFQ